MGKYYFKKDIHLGEEGEKVVIKDLKNLGFKFIRDNKNIDFDLLVEKDGKRHTFEVKTDDLCTPKSDTGNMFIEIECRGKPSGIAATKAKKFAYYYKHFGEIWYISIKDLTELIKNNNFKVVKNSGDTGSNTVGILIPRYKFKKHFTVRKV